MEGVIGNSELEGIIPRTIKDTFEFIRNTTENIEFTVKISMVEIYMERVKDIIDPSRKDLNIREDKARGIFIEDLSEHYVGCEEEVLDLIKFLNTYDSASSISEVLSPIESEGTINLASVAKTPSSLNFL